jgi:hypothetical protein
MESCRHPRHSGHMARMPCMSAPCKRALCAVSGFAQSVKGNASFSSFNTPPPLVPGCLPTCQHDAARFELDRQRVQPHAHSGACSRGQNHPPQIPLAACIFTCGPPGSLRSPSATIIAIARRTSRAGAEVLSTSFLCLHLHPPLQSVRGYITVQVY